MYPVTVKRDLYYWKLFSYGAYKLSQIDVHNATYPSEVISYYTFSPMDDVISEDTFKGTRTFYEDTGDAFAMSNSDWHGTGHDDIVTIDAGTKGLSYGKSKAKSSASKYISYAQCWNDALKIKTDSGEFVYLKDDKVSCSKSKNRTENPIYFREIDQVYEFATDTVDIPSTVANGYYGTTISRSYTLFDSFNNKKLGAAYTYEENPVNIKSAKASAEYTTSRASVDSTHIIKE